MRGGWRVRHQGLHEQLRLLLAEGQPRHGHLPPHTLQTLAALIAAAAAATAAAAAAAAARPAATL